MTSASHPDFPAASSLPPGRGGAYYFCQALSWGAYGVLFYILSARRQTPGALAGALVWCGCGMAGTHLLRAYSRRHPWHTIGQLLPRVAGAIILVPLAMLGAQTAANLLFAAPGGAYKASVWVAVAHFFQAFIVVLLWCALYFSAQEMRRRRAAETEALRLALVAQVAQFRALRSQLNPHFLFNCLNNLCELIDQEPERAKQVVIRLSGLLRYTLQADRLETVTLQEELDVVEDYLSLEKIRFEERLRLRYDIAPDSLAARVPPMLLQTLAENALKHGIAKTPAGGELLIKAFLTDGDLEIQVTNPGSLSDGNGSTQLGLENARARLRLVYGERASLTLRAEGPLRVRASAVLPSRPEATLP